MPFFGAIPNPKAHMSSSRTAVPFSTSPFQFGHGRMLRGRSSWAFCFNHDEMVHWGPGGPVVVNVCT